MSRTEDGDPCGPIHLGVVDVLVESLVEGQLEQLQGSRGAGTLVGDRAHELEIAYGFRLRENVVQLVPNLHRRGSRNTERREDTRVGVGKRREVASRVTRVRRARRMVQSKRGQAPKGTPWTYFLLRGILADGRGLTG